MFFTLQEAQNRPTGVSVPALRLYNKAICSLLYRKPRTDQKELIFLLQDCPIKLYVLYFTGSPEQTNRSQCSCFRTVQYSYMFFTLQEAQNRPAGAIVPALGLYNKAICSSLDRKPRTDQQELVFRLQDCLIKLYIQERQRRFNKTSRSRLILMISIQKFILHLSLCKVCAISHNFISYILLSQI